jgi:signal transduction histidine kinase
VVTVRNFRPTVADTFVAVAVTVFIVGATEAIAYWHPDAGAATHPMNGLAALWLAACGLALLWRSVAPISVLAVTTALVFGYYASGFPGGPAIISPTVALITVAFLRGPLVGGLSGVVVAAVVIVETLLLGDHNGLFDPRLAGFLLWVVVAVGIGVLFRMHNAIKRGGRERAAEADRLRAEEQRLRIAREVHDVVAHSLAMINVQAGVAVHVADRRPDEAKAALLAIKDASRTALTDLRATLGVLRSGDERAPTPGLGRLPDLVSTASAAGVTVATDGDPGALPAPVDVAAYRILQECVTNVVRHATGADTVRITFTRTEDDLEITVLDNGRTDGNPGKPGGNGLRGMAERAHALGGEVVAGPVPAGGFAVHASLPVTGGAR